METSFLSSPTTCVKFVHSFVLVGEGSWLRVFGLSGDCWNEVNRFRVFSSNSVHGIQQYTIGNESSWKLCVFGGRCLRILCFQTSPIPQLSALGEPITFPDWIWDVKWFENDRVGLVLSQNYALLYDVTNNRTVEVSHCEEKCILYCGIFVGERWSEAAVLAGTVFQQILIWRTDGTKCERSTRTGRPVLHRLTGHDGVIFSIHYDRRWRKLCSSSDDRSMQIWHHQLPTESSHTGQQEKVKEEEEVTPLDWSGSKLVLLCKLYGHESRVWKVLNFGSTFVSAGEDSVLCFWVYSDVEDTWTLGRRVTCHGQSSVRSLDIHPNHKLLVTGGGNGEVKLWQLTGNNSEDKIESADETQHFPVDLTNCEELPDCLSAVDYPRETKLLDLYRLLIVTNEGSFLLHDTRTSRTKFLLRDTDFHSYCVIDVRPVDQDSSDVVTTEVCVGDLQGGATFFRSDRSEGQESFSKVGHIRVFDGKVMSLKMLNLGDKSYLLICGPQGIMVLYEVKCDGAVSVRRLCRLLLPTSRYRWFTAAALLTAATSFPALTLVCGGRNGTIYLFRIEDQRPSTTEPEPCYDPVQSFHRLHGANGVTDILCRGPEDFVRSSGRDGFLASFQMTADGLLRLFNKTRIAGCSKWIAGLRALNGETFILGFHTDNFIVWNEQCNSAVLRVACGGGHRAWDFKMTDNCLRFCYVKDRAVFYYDAKIAHSTPIRLKCGFHNRQICSIHHIMTTGDFSYVASSSEDCSTNILRVARSSDAKAWWPATVECVGRLKTHISSVKAATSCQWHGDQRHRLVVTVGGRAQLVCWRLHADHNGATDEIKVEELVSHMLHPEGRRCKKPWQHSKLTFDPETRYMDVAVWPVNSPQSGPHYGMAIACSDSFLRIYSLDVTVSSSRVELLVEDPAHGRCLLKVRHLQVGTRPDRLLLSSDTDGYVVLWHVTDVERSVPDAPSPRIFTTRPHQSGVTAMEAIVVQSTEAGANDNRTTLLVATGGDDADVVLSVLVVEPSACGGATQRLTAKLMCRAVVAANHSAQVTGIVLTPFRFWTASVDHRVTGWSYQYCPLSSKIETERLYYVMSNISDISSMAGWISPSDTSSDHQTSFDVMVVGQGMEIYRVENINASAVR